MPPLAKWLHRQLLVLKDCLAKLKLHLQRSGHHKDMPPEDVEVMLASATVYEDTVQVWDPSADQAADPAAGDGPHPPDHPPPPKRHRAWHQAPSFRSSHVNSTLGRSTASCSRKFQFTFAGLCCCCTL